MEFQPVQCGEKYRRAMNQKKLLRKVNEENLEKFERKYMEPKRQHSRFQRKLDQRLRNK